MIFLSPVPWRKLAGPLALGVAALASDSVARACSCAPQLEPSIALEKVTDAFVGQVVGRWPSVERLRDDRELELVQRFTFRVLTRWKGAEGANVELLVDNSNCEYIFDVGETYAVFAHRDANAGGALRSSICLPTCRASDMTAAYSALVGTTAAPAIIPAPVESWPHRIGRLVQTSWLIGRYAARSKWDVGLSEAARVAIVSVLAVVATILMFPAGRWVRRRPSRSLYVLAALSAVVLVWFLASGFYHLQTDLGLEALR